MTPTSTSCPDTSTWVKSGPPEAQGASGPSCEVVTQHPQPHPEAPGTPLHQAQLHAFIKTNLNLRATEDLTEKTTFSDKTN